MNEYRNHAVNSLLVKKSNAIKQRGKSDIEPLSYVDNTTAWFCMLIALIDKDIPKYYIRNLKIDRNDDREILGYEYEYYEIGEKIGDMSLIITLL